MSFGKRSCVLVAAACAMTLIASCASDRGAASPSAPTVAPSSTTSTTSTTQPTAETFDVTTVDYVLRFNSFHRLTIGAVGTVVDELSARNAGAGLCGSHVTSTNGIYVMAKCAGGERVAGAVVTAPYNGGNVSTPVRVILAACSALLETGRSLEAVGPFSDALPQLSSVSTSSRIHIGEYFDIGVIVRGDTVGFVCVPPNADMPQIESLPA